MFTPSATPSRPSGRLTTALKTTTTVDHSRIDRQQRGGVAPIDTGSVPVPQSAARLPEPAASPAPRAAVAALTDRHRDRRSRELATDLQQVHVATWANAVAAASRSPASSRARGDTTPSPPRREPWRPPYGSPFRSPPVFSTRGATSPTSNNADAGSVNRLSPCRRRDGAAAERRSMGDRLAAGGDPSAAGLYMETLSLERDFFRSEVETAVARADELARQNAALTAECAPLAKAVADTTVRNEELKARIERLECTKREQDADLAATREREASLLRSAEMLEPVFSQLRVRCEETTRRADDASNALQCLESELSTTRSEKAALREQLKAAIERQNDLAAAHRALHERHVERGRHERHLLELQEQDQRVVLALKHDLIWSAVQSSLVSVRLTCERDAAVAQHEAMRASRDRLQTEYDLIAPFASPTRQKTAASESQQLHQEVYEWTQRASDATTAMEFEAASRRRADQHASEATRAWQIAMLEGDETQVRRQLERHVADGVNEIIVSFAHALNILNVDLHMSVVSSERVIAEYSRRYGRVYEMTERSTEMPRAPPLQSSGQQTDRVVTRNAGHDAEDVPWRDADREREKALVQSANDARAMCELWQRQCHDLEQVVYACEVARQRSMTDSKNALSSLRQELTAKDAAHADALSKVSSENERLRDINRRLQEGLAECDGAVKALSQAFAAHRDGTNGDLNGFGGDGGRLKLTLAEAAREAAERRAGSAEHMARNAQREALARDEACRRAAITHDWELYALSRLYSRRTPHSSARDDTVP